MSSGQKCRSENYATCEERAVCTGKQADCPKSEPMPDGRGCIGEKHALKKYDQFAPNTSSYWGSYWIKYYPSCAISRNFCDKNNE